MTPVAAPRARQVARSATVARPPPKNWAKESCVRDPRALRRRHTTIMTYAEKPASWVGAMPDVPPDFPVPQHAQSMCALCHAGPPVAALARMAL